MAIDWDVPLGSTLKRTDLQQRYGGGEQGGIAPSAKTPNVLIFSDPIRSKANGYPFDRWDPDGTYHYTGEGRFGDQTMVRGNKAIRDHAREGRTLRLFETKGTQATYLGEFEVPDDSYYFRGEALDADQKEMRSVIVFRLKPASESQIAHTVESLAAPGSATVVPLEANNVDLYVWERKGTASVESLRKEAALVRRYTAWLGSQGLTFERHTIPTAGGKAMFTDIWVPEHAELIEAKASSSRSHLRTALGQVLDYSRYVDHRSRAILVPTRPEADMESLLVDYGVRVIWESEKAGEFESSKAVDHPQRS